MAPGRFTEEERDRLLSLARASIRHGLDRGAPLLPDLSEFPSSLREPGASFVTLDIDGHLRGCIGCLEAFRPLVEDIAENAFAAAFRDPRFAPLDAREFQRLGIHISVLSPPEALAFDDERDLLGKIRPGIDGLILEDKDRRGTFLPSVWESLPEPRDFLRHLKLKAGLSADHWSNTLRVQRYTTEAFP